MGSVPLLILSNLCFAETFTLCNLSLALSLAQAHTPRQGLQKTCGKIWARQPALEKLSERKKTGYDDPTKIYKILAKISLWGVLRWDPHRVKFVGC
nr:MAG TPA: hypothetical protein [Caudoviricetes sp.]